MVVSVCRESGMRLGTKRPSRAVQGRAGNIKPVGDAGRIWLGDIPGVGWGGLLYLLYVCILEAAVDFIVFIFLSRYSSARDMKELV